MHKGYELSVWNRWKFHLFIPNDLNLEKMHTLEVICLHRFVPINLKWCMNQEVLRMNFFVDWSLVKINHVLLNWYNMCQVSDCLVVSSVSLSHFFLSYIPLFWYIAPNIHRNNQPKKMKRTFEERENFECYGNSSKQEISYGKSHYLI